MIAKAGTGNSERIGSVGRIGNNERSLPSNKSSDTPGFDQLLRSQVGSAPAPVGELRSTNQVQNLQFSNHAIERIRSRGIVMGPERMEKLSQAIDKAASKGAKETLVMAGDSAFIVSVKNRTVITAMDAKAMKENVFTNIDSTVLI